MDYPVQQFVKNVLIVIVYYSELTVNVALHAPIAIHSKF